MLQSALELSRDIGDVSEQVRTLLSLSVVYNQVDQLDDLKITLESALELCKDIDDDLVKAHVMKGLGDLYRRLDRSEKAKQMLQATGAVATIKSHVTLIRW